jgi:hypothetical protein
LSVFSQVRFSKIVVLVCLRFCSAKSVFIASVLVGCRFWLFSVLASSVFLPLLKNKLCVKVRRVGRGSGFQSASLAQSQPTKRAPDAGDSGAFPSIFLRLSIFPVGRRPAARPSAGNANRWAVPLHLKK